MPTEDTSPGDRLPFFSGKGFTIPELVIGVMLLGGFLLLSLGVVTAGKRLMPGRGIAVGQEVLPVAPSPGVFADAVRLDGVLLEHLRRARAIYVFGGRHEGLPAGATRLNGAPLSLNALPTLTVEPEVPLPSDAFGFYHTYASVLGPLASDPAPGEFSVLVLGPAGNHLQATALLQVRESSVQVGEGDQAERYLRREAVLYEANSVAWRYAFLERVQAAPAARVGARHFWYRYEEGRVAEEGPALVVLPDPWLYAGGSDQLVPLPAFSRFVHFLGVSP